MTLSSNQTPTRNIAALYLVGLLAPATGLAADDFFLRGDADSNGVVEMTDAVLVVDWLFQGGNEPACMDAADTNDDGAIDISDAILVLDVLYQGSELPEPYDDVGTDPTDDDLGCQYGLPIDDGSAQCGDSFRLETYGRVDGSCSGVFDVVDRDLLSQVECPTECPAQIELGTARVVWSCQISVTTYVEAWAEKTVICGE